MDNREARGLVGSTLIIRLGHLKVDPEAIFVRLTWWFPFRSLTVGDQ
jgi:hypothetical protein